MRGIDAVLQELPGGIYDLKIGFDGDIETEDSFDTAVVVSLLSDRRANESEVVDSSRRRGWIGNEVTPDFEIGSKIWIFEQARLTRTTMNGIADAARDALQWFVDDDLVVAIRNVQVVVAGRDQIGLEVTIERSPSQVEKRFFTLWENTGI